MTIRMADGRIATLDYRETAPAAATRNMYVDSAGKLTNKSTVGYLASGVPGSVAGMVEALSKYGSMPLAKVMAPAIRLANDGYLIDRDTSRAAAPCSRLIAQFGGKDLFCPGGEGEAWSFRSGFSFDRFAGADSVDNVQMITFGGDIVHQSSRWYQFAGFGLYSTTQTYKSTGAPTSESLRTRKEQNFGVSAGAGATLGSGEVKPFVAFAANLVWGATGNYTWYPVRAGLKF
jgi:hypothetical protein